MLNRDRDERVERARSIRLEDEIARRGITLKRQGRELVGPCPKCGGTDRFSINVSKQIFNCRGCGKGGDIIDLVTLLDGGDFNAALDTLAPDHAGKRAKKANGHPKPNGASAKVDNGKKDQDPAATHDYVDADGKLALQVLRYHFHLPDDSPVLERNGKPRKTFRQRQPDPDEPKLWIWGVTKGEYLRRAPGADWYPFKDENWSKLVAATRQRKTIAADVPPLPYKLPELLEAIGNRQLVYVVEGEAKVDLLASWGIVATCCAQGAGKWTAEHAAFLRGGDVIILPDNDDPGRKHAESVAHSLKDIAARIRVLELPGLPPKGDIMDWHEAGGSREMLDEWAEQAPDWKSSEAKPDHRQQQKQITLSARNLNAMRFEPIKYVVPGIIVEGLTLLAAKPKMGKSWMMLHAAVAVARGGYTLGDIQCTEGDVLYCALEDNLRRLQSRMTKIMGMQEWPERLFFRCELPLLTNGGLAEIKTWIGQANQPRLIIIDTLAMVRAPKKRDESNYEADYAAVKELRTLANQHGVAIVLVHHLRKADSDDAFDTVSGTLGLTGAPDTILVLKRDSSGSTVLHGRGRDLVEVEKAVTFNQDTCIWSLAGEAREVRTSNQRKAILAAMQEIELPASPADIAAASNMACGSVRHILPKMINDGTVRKCSYGKYDLASPSQPA